jgi:hypothetical protein
MRRDYNAFGGTMKKIKEVGASFALALIACSVSAGTSYTSEAAFVSAINPTYYLENFNSFTFGSPLNGSQTTYVAPGSNGYGWTASASSGLYSNNSALSVNVANDPLTITFSGLTVSAFGGIVANTDPSGNLIAGTVTINTSDGGSAFVTLPAGTSGFLGYTSTVPITSVTFTATGATTNNFVQIDHFYTGASATFGTSGEVGQNYVVFKEIKSNQSDVGTIVLASNAYRMLAFVQATSNGSITGGTMSLPAGSSATSPQALALQTNPQNDGTYGFQQNFADPATLNSNYADGTYGLQITGASSATHNANLSLTGGVYPSLTPTINNTSWNSGNLITDPSLSFQLTWGAFTGSTATDRIAVSVGRVQDSTVSFQAMPASATSVIFPASYFQLGQVYAVHVVFLKVATTDTTDIPGSTGFAGYGRETKFNIQPTVFKIVPTHPASNTVHLQCLGVPSATNRIESSPDLNPNNFGPLTSQGANGSGTFQYDDTTAATKKFYRIAYP